MKIKTFPLQFTEADHAKLKQAADDAGLSLKDFIFAAIDKAFKEGQVME